jgi:hypothetical protein
MNNLTLLTVNWNQRRVMELMLKSFVYTMYLDSPLELMLVENGSTDDSKQWLTENGVPFIDSPINIGHEQAVNMVYKKIQTRYCLLVDTDVIFMSPPGDYLMELNHTRLAAGELMTGDNLGYPMKPRLSPWFFLFDIKKMKSLGVHKFRDTPDWSYDVGAWYTEQIISRGFDIHNIPRKPGDIDRDVIGMDYGTHRHLGKMSWALGHHKDRVDEVAMRMRYVEEQLKLYEDIDLKGKFI